MMKYSLKLFPHQFLNLLDGEKRIVIFIKKHTDTLIEQNKTHLQETIQFRSNKQMETFSLNPPINLYEEGKWLLVVNSFDATNCILT